MKNPRIKDKIKPAVFSFLSLWGLTAFVKNGPGLIWIILYAFIFIAFSHIFRIKRSKTVIIASYLLGFVVSIMVFLEYEITHNNGVDIYPKIIIMFIGLFTFFSILSQGVLSYLLANQTDFSIYNSSGKVKRILLLSVLIFIFWLPYFFACFPGNLTSDSLGEIRQQLGLSPLSNHHPVIHQLMIKPFLLLANITGNLTCSIAVFSLVQMYILAFSFSLCIEYLRRRGTGTAIRLAVFAFYALFTINGFYSVTMYKDVPFAVSALILMLLLLKESDGEYTSTIFSKVMSVIVIVIVAFLFCTLRNNGYYAFLFGFVFVILFNLKNYKRLLIIFVSTLVLVAGYKFLLFNVLDVARSSTGEMMGLPLQMLARIVKYDQPDFDSEDFSIIGNVIADYDLLAARYIPDNSDPIKSSDVFLADEFDKAPVKYMKSWMKICCSHFRTSLDAFLIHTYGFWAPDENYSSISARIHENDFGLAQSLKTAAFRDNLIVLHTSLSSSQPISILYSIGFMVILYFLAFILIVLKKVYRYAGPMFILFFLWLTAAAAPLCLYQYVYGLTVSLPLFLTVALNCKSLSGEGL